MNNTLRRFTLNIKVFFILGICFTLIISLIGFSTSYANPRIGVYIDNRPLTMDVPPVLIKGRTLISISALASALNCNTTWNEKNQSVIIRNNKSIIRLSINSKLAYIDDNIMTLDYPPTIINSRTMVPLSFVAKALNYNIKWDPVLMNVHVKTQTNNMVVSGKRESHDQITVMDAATLKMNINGEMKTVKLNGVTCIKEKNTLLTGSSACISNSYSDSVLYKIRFIIQSGDISTKIINTLDPDTVIAEVFIDGTSLSELLLELGYVVEIE